MADHSPTCKYTARLERVGDRYVVEVPDREVDLGPLSPGDVCQVSLDLSEQSGTTPASSEQLPVDGDQPPVTVGERLTVEIEDVGQQGDGITRVGQGYVLIVPGSEVGDEVSVEVQQINPTYGFAEIVDDDRGYEDEAEIEDADPGHDDEEEPTAIVED